MNKQFKRFLKEVLANVKRTFTYDQIIHMLAQKIKEPMEFGSKEKNPSGYIKKVINQDNRVFISMRFGTHLPVLRHLIGENNIPSDKEYAHNCLLFLGAEEYKALGTEKGNHQMSERRTSVEVDVNYDVFEYYKLPKRIPFHIYHLIPELINENDISLIAGEVEEWLYYDGDEPLIMPSDLSQDVYYRNNDKRSISSIDCYIDIYVKGQKPIRETAGITSGRQYIMSIDMGTVTIVSPEREELTLQGILNVTKCNSFDLSVLQEIYSFDIKQDDSDDFDFDAALKGSDKRPDRKRFDEQLSEIRDRHPELYESIMTEIESVIEKYLN